MPPPCLAWQGLQQACKLPCILRPFLSHYFPFPDEIGTVFARSLYAYAAASKQRRRALQAGILLQHDAQPTRPFISGILSRPKTPRSKHDEQHEQS